MSAELELVSDGSGLAVVGAEDAIEQFMLDLDLVSVESQSLAHVATEGAHRAGGLGGLALQAGGQIAAESGRWLKLTEESAAKVREFQLGELASDRGLARLELADARCRVLAEHLERGGERAVTAGGSTLAGECTCPLGVRG